MRPLLAIILTLLTLSACRKADAPASTSTAPVSSAATPASRPASVAAGGTVANQLASAVTLQCEQRAHDVAGNEATSWYMKCPAGCVNNGAVWGTDLYTDDSQICVAAIHAQAIAADQGGTVLVTWAPGQESFAGSERNGVSTNDYGHWPRSFFVQKIDANGQPISPAPKPLAEGSARVSCRMSPGTLGGEPGKQWRVSCPAGCDTVGSFWGTDLYTADSPICAAAIHAGVITAAGGDATITIEGPQKSFKGSARNGITTQDYGEYGGSFRVTK
jgi:hypothetical protein